MDYHVSVWIDMCPPMGLPRVTYVLPFCVAWKKLQNTISSSYEIRLSRFKWHRKSLVELFMMETFALSFETFEFEAFWILLDHAGRDCGI
jgi:hypothetical protein